MPPRKRNDAPGTQRPTKQQADTFDRLVPMLEAAHREMTELSKKKQDGVVNSFKITTINRLLAELSKVIESDASHEFVDMLDEDLLPQNSDAVLVLSQWKAALAQFKSKHYGWDGGTQRWFTA